MTNPALVRFADASVEEALTGGLVRCGFELEVQRSEGRRYGDFRTFLNSLSICSDPEAKKEQIRQEMYRMWHDNRNWLVDASNYIQSRSTIDPEIASRLMVSSSLVSRLLPTFVVELWNRINPDRPFPTPAELGVLRSHMDSSLMPEYVRHLSRKYDQAEIFRLGFSGLNELEVRLAAWLGSTEAAKLLSYHSDGTVSGPEWVTKDGGCTYDEWRTAVDALFSKTHVIDNRCSFHIHLSVPGVNHQYGAKFQQAALEFLVDNRHMIPSGVVERMVDPDWSSRYFATGLNSEKYTAVAYRGSTWEYRLWGNVKTREDADKCLLLSVGSLRHAARVVLGKEQLAYSKALFEQTEEHSDESGDDGDCYYIAPAHFVLAGNDSRLAGFKLAPAAAAQAQPSVRAPITAEPMSSLTAQSTHYTPYALSDGRVVYESDAGVYDGPPASCCGSPGGCSGNGYNTRLASSLHSLLDHLNPDQRRFERTGT